MCDGPDLFLILISVIFPPLAVWVKRGLCSADSLINIALCTLGFLPGLLHAWYIISKYPDSGYEQIQDAEEGTVRVLYVSGGPPPPSAGPTAGAHSTPTAGYGTLASQNKSKAQPQSQPQQGSSSQTRAPQQLPQRQEQMGPKTSALDDAAGPSDGAAPPSYAEVVQGDHKIQSHE